MNFRPVSSLSSSIATLLPVLALAIAIPSARGEIWSATSASNSIWSDAGNWTDSVAGDPAPPGVDGQIYTNVRLNINGAMTYTAAQGTQTYDISAAAGENRALVISSGTSTTGNLTMTGGHLIVIQESNFSTAVLGEASGTGALTLSGGSLTVNKLDAAGDATFSPSFGLGA